jgi:hypothetical protein
MIPAVSAATVSTALLSYQWVAVGASGNLATSTSTTLASWTSRTSSFSTTQINAVASNLTSLYVAVGNSGKLATSSDAATWTQQTSSFSASNIRCVAFGNGVWVAGGAAGKLATSTDGTTWTQRTSGTASAIECVAYGNGLWIFQTDVGAISTATDPTSTWTARTSTVSNGGRNNVHYFKAQSIWIAGCDTGTTGALASSTDGLTWTSRNSAFSQQGGLSPTTSNATVAIVGGATDAITPVADVESTTNGTTYTDRTPAGTNQIFQCAASDDSNLMVLSGNGGIVHSSSDGTTWTARTATGFQTFGICHSSGMPSNR